MPPGVRRLRRGRGARLAVGYRPDRSGGTHATCCAQGLPALAIPACQRGEGGVRWTTSTTRSRQMEDGSRRAPFSQRRARMAVAPRYIASARSTASCFLPETFCYKARLNGLLKRAMRASISQSASLWYGCSERRLTPLNSGSRVPLFVILQSLRRWKCRFVPSTTGLS